MMAVSAPRAPAPPAVLLSRKVFITLHSIRSPPKINVAYINLLSYSVLNEEDLVYLGGVFGIE